MTRLLNVATQTIATASQMLVPVFVSDPALAQKVHVGLGFIQLVLSYIAHAYNPDGTKAEVAYIPKDKL